MLTVRSCFYRTWTVSLCESDASASAVDSSMNWLGCMWNNDASSLLSYHICGNMQIRMKKQGKAYSFNRSEDCRPRCAASRMTSRSLTQMYRLLFPARKWRFCFNTPDLQEEKPFALHNSCVPWILSPCDHWNSRPTQKLHDATRSQEALLILLACITLGVKLFSLLSSLLSSFVQKPRHYTKINPCIIEQLASIRIFLRSQGRPPPSSPLEACCLCCSNDLKLTFVFII